jgi:hypothetical protein
MNPSPNAIGVSNPLPAIRDRCHFEYEYEDAYEHAYGRCMQPPRPLA